MAKCPRGLTILPAGEIDYSPGVGVKDCLRQVARALPDLPPGAIDDYTEDAVRDLVETIADEAYAYMLARNPDAESDMLCWPHARAADFVRMRVIDLLRAHHRAAGESDDDASEPARSGLFREAEVFPVRGIDATARVVGGTDPAD